MKTIASRLLLAGILTILLAACYSVKIRCRDCLPEKDPTNQDQATFGQMVVSVDTATKLGLFKDNAWLVKPCGDKGFYMVEMRVTLGMLMANTFRKKKIMKVKYICEEQ